LEKDHQSFPDYPNIGCELQIKAQKRNFITDIINDINEPTYGYFTENYAISHGKMMNFINCKIMILLFIIE